MNEDEILGHDMCEIEVLSESSACTITHCKSCHTYQLHIGSISIRLKEYSFKSISNTILNARINIVTENNINIQSGH